MYITELLAVITCTGIDMGLILSENKLIIHVLICMYLDIKMACKKVFVLSTKPLFLSDLRHCIHLGISIFFTIQKHFATNI